MKKKKVVIALGGNALGKNVEEQKEAVAKTAKVIVDLASQGLDIIITHGNGPQVGMIQEPWTVWWYSTKIINRCLCRPAWL